MRSKNMSIWKVVVLGSGNQPGRKRPMRIRSRRIADMKITIASLMLH
jgi:hypothetical protein